MNDWNGEVWRPVDGYEDLYEVSNKGRVKSLKGWSGNKHFSKYVEREKILKGSMTSTGYWKVELVKNKIVKSHKVHRLVAKAFLDNPNNYMTVNHIDGNPLNNCVDNLEWCTQKHNVQHAIDTGLKKVFDVPRDVLEDMYIERQMQIDEIASIYSVSSRTISNLLKKHGIRKEGVKYNISIEELKRMFEQGKTNKEIAELYNRDSRLIATRKYQIKKGAI